MGGFSPRKRRRRGTKSQTKGHRTQMVGGQGKRRRRDPVPGFTYIIGRALWNDLLRQGGLASEGEKAGQAGAGLADPPPTTPFPPGFGGGRTHPPPSPGGLPTFKRSLCGVQRQRKSWCPPPLDAQKLAATSPCAEPCSRCQAVLSCQLLTCLPASGGSPLPTTPPPFNTPPPPPHLPGKSIDGRTEELPPPEPLNIVLV